LSTNSDEARFIDSKMRIEMLEVKEMWVIKYLGLDHYSSSPSPSPSASSEGSYWFSYSGSV